MSMLSIPRGPVGPGSQPESPDGAELVYLPLPQAMRTYQPPRLPETTEAGACPEGLRLLERLRVQLQSYRVLEPSRVLDVLTLPAADRHLVGQALGEGEVSILFAGDGILRVQETRLAGVWRVQTCGELGQILSDEIEVADIPSQVRETAFADARTSLDLDQEPPEGVITARSVLVELNAQAQQWRLGDPPHVINLTLLPQCEQDLAYLDARLGLGPVTILSRGYGNCRITATALRHCWWVQHFNADDRLILNTIEVVDIPAAALAAQEDIEDSAGRLGEILTALR